MLFELNVLFFAIASVFTIISLYTQNYAFRTIGGVMFLFLGMMLLFYGIDVQSGTDIASVIANNTTTLTSEVATYTTVSDMYTGLFGTVLLLTGLYLMLSIVAYREK